MAGAKSKKRGQAQELVGGNGLGARLSVVTIRPSTGEWTVPEHWPSTAVSAIMTRHPTTISPRTSAIVARDIMLDQKLHALPVLDETTGRVVGVLTKTELLREGDRLREGFFSETDGWGAVIDRRLAVEDAERSSGEFRRAEELMTPYVRVIPANMSVGEAASIMVHDNMHQLIVSSDGRTAGMITMTDILRWLLGKTLIASQSTEDRKSAPDGMKNFALNVDDKEGETR